MENHQDWNQIWLDYQSYNRTKLLMIYKKLAISSLDRKIAILDIGCATGTFLSILRENGFNNLCGWEPQIDLVNNKLDESVEIGNCLDDLENKGYHSRFDVIFIIGVLHHLGSLEEISTCIKNVHLLLKNNGVFVSVEPHKTLVRSFATSLMMSLPDTLLPSNVVLDKSLVKHEQNELGQWLNNYQVKCDQMLSKNGFFAENTTKQDWRYRYLVLRKLSHSS
jgi:2-polyprenyl-3-methyl-5-hydroxy-6-metoxy-1,4-benzoquinol methylase